MARKASHSALGGSGFRRDLLRGTVNSVGTLCAPDRSPVACVTSSEYRLSSRAVSSPGWGREESPSEDFLGLLVETFVVRSISSPSQFSETSRDPSSCRKDPSAKKMAGSGEDSRSESISIDASPFSLKARERLIELRLRVVDDAPG